MTNLIGHSLGRYHILEQLGEGGMAVVYKARDTQLEREVAIKIIRTDLFGSAVLKRILIRFEREARSLAKLSHPNIVGVVEYGEHEGTPFLVMEYIPSGTLKTRMGKPIVWHEAVGQLLPIAKALAYSHQHGIIHRDVKPSNILITDGSDLMLTDFGIAKLLESEDGHTLSTGTGVGIGTPEYMAPEQGMGHEVDTRADVYSLGIVLYEMLTGKKPFTADTPMAVIVKHINEPIPRPKTYVPNLPDAAERLLLKALAKQPKERYPDMNSFAKEMEKALLAHQAQVAKSSPKPVVAPQPIRKEAPPVAVTKQKMESARPPTRRVEFKLPAISRRAVITGGLIALGIGLLAVFSSALKALPATLFPTAAPSNTLTVTNTPQLEFTLTNNTMLVPGSTPTPMYTPTATSLPTEITDAQGVSMRLVPAGEFTMGADETSNPTPSPNFRGGVLLDPVAYYKDIKPVHKVYLDIYYIDTYEVTNNLYKVCVDAAVCAQPLKTYRYNDPVYVNHPVGYVDWLMAETYCKWRGGRLPTEAEWEKAARGTDGRTYPWGDEVDSSKANYGGYTVEVGSYKSGVSPYGLYDMAGNVWEWVADWYSETYYQISPASNPLGPGSGQSRVLRGGGYDSSPNSVSTYNRYAESPSSNGFLFGFRCASGIP